MKNSMMDIIGQSKKMTGNLQLKGFNKKLLQFLIKDENDFAEFINTFWDENKKFFSVNGYRLHKIQMKNLSYSDFENLFNQDKKKALEELFQHPVLDYDVALLEKKIENNKEKLAELYWYHKQYPSSLLLVAIQSI